jgi:hypothetical protein
MPLVAGAALTLGTSDLAIDQSKYSINFGGVAGGSINIWRKKYQK